MEKVHSMSEGVVAMEAMPESHKCHICPRE